MASIHKLDHTYAHVWLTFGKISFDFGKGTGRVDVRVNDRPVLDVQDTYGIPVAWQRPMLGNPQWPGAEFTFRFVGKYDVPLVKFKDDAARAKIPLEWRAFLLGHIARLLPAQVGLTQGGK